MNDFLNIQVEEISGKPPIIMFTSLTNIRSIQTVVSNIWEKPVESDTIKNIIRTLLNASKSDHNQTLMITDDGRLSYNHPKCHECGSASYKKNGTQKRKLKSSFKTNVDITLQKYKCKDCGAHFKINLDQIIPRYGHYTSDIRTQATGYSGARALSLGESVDLTREVTGVRICRETIRTWKNRKGAEVRTKMENETKTCSGIYSYDEQYVTIKGERWYRALLIDVVSSRPVSDVVLPNRENSTLKSFLRTSLESQPVYTFVTDCGPQYPSLIKDAFPNASHQICIIHMMFNTKCDFYEAAGFSRYSDHSLPEDLQKLYGKLWGVFLHSKNADDAEERFYKIYSTRFDYPVKVRHRLELISKSFIQLTEYLIYEDVPMTNNTAEGYFQRTYPSRVKTRFRTPDGLQAQISCIDGSKGGIEEGWEGIHEILRTIYQTFAHIIVKL